MVIVNARLSTMAGLDQSCGYLSVRDGKISAVGPMAECPADPDRFDAQGAFALPGLVDAHCHLGMWGDGLGFEGDDGNEDTDPATPQLRGIDGINPLDRAFAEALDYGVTTVVSGPGSANPIAGQLCALKTHGRRVDDMLLRDPLAMKFALGENPKTSYHEKPQGPATRMMIAAIIREQLQKAQKYQKQLEEAAEDEELAEPEFDAKCEALLPVLRREMQAHFHAHRADDIFTAIRIAKEFALDYVIVHGTEGHLVSEELAAEGTRVIVGPLIGARTKPELVNANAASPGLLHQAGVSVAICSDHPEIPVRHLMMCARLAVEEGMQAEDAIRAVTAEAACICGLEERVGRLAPGLDADVVLYREDPIKAGGRPLAVFIDGRRVR